MMDRSPSSYLGVTVGERYRVTSLLGQGGMGVLFVAEHLFTKRRVALKLLHPAREDLPDLRARFIGEARTAAATRHPNIVDVLDMGLTEDGSPFLVMELLEGVSLDQLLKRKGRLSPEEALAYLLPIAGALALLHDADIVHRDIKPSNIFLAEQPKGGVCPKLLDFGLARAISDLRLTRSGVVLGTPMYMAPEQASGESVSIQSDVWSLGVVLYECMTGEPPFTSSDSQAIAVQVLAGRTRPMRAVCPEIPMPLAEAVERCLRGNRELRYADMRGLAAGLVAGAAAGGVALPADPDPVGLPNYRRWLAVGTQPITTQEIELPRAKPAAAIPVQDSPPNTQIHAEELKTTGQLEHEVLHRPSGVRRALVLLALVAIVSVIGWQLLQQGTDSVGQPLPERPRVLPIQANTPPPAGSTAPVVDIKPPPGGATAPGIDLEPPPPQPAELTPAPAEVGDAKTDTAELQERPKKTGKKKPVVTTSPEPATGATPKLPQSQGGVPLEDEWK